jgi:hypothetical protein
MNTVFSRKVFFCTANSFGRVLRNWKRKSTEISTEVQECSLESWLHPDV